MDGRLRLLCAAVAFFVTAAPVYARVPRAERHDALAVAAGKWGDVCTAQPQIRFQRLRDDTLGMAQWDGMWDIPPDQRDGCRIVLNSRKSWDWGTLCTTVVHEWGHLAGHGHSENAGSSMYPRYEGAYPGCVRGRAARRWSG